MTEPKYIYKLNSVIKQLKDEDLVPALFLMEMDKEFNTFYGFNRELDKILMRNFNQIINRFPDSKYKKDSKESN